MLPYKQVTKDFLKAVLSGEKRLLKMAQVKFCNVPAYDEIAVKHIFQDVAGRLTMRAFFPDTWAKGT
jgi:hypothetical protein